MADSLPPGGQADAGVTPSPASPVLSIVAGLPFTSHTFRSGETVAGRSSDADIPLAHPEISRRHCRFRWKGVADCTVEDLQSHWGTWLNGSVLEPGTPVPLHAGDSLRLGPVVAFFGWSPPTPEQIRAILAGPLPALSGNPQLLYKGRETDQVTLGGGSLTFGRGGDVDVVLSDAAVSRRQATIERVPAGYEVTDLRSKAGSLVNGRRFEKHLLVIGDQLQFGPFFFRFDGRALERVSQLHSVAVEARHVRRSAGAVAVLDDVSLRIDRGQFVMILGPSGAGKSSLLDILVGLRPADAGAVSYEGKDITCDSEAWRSLLGYVPQDDIVHRELTPAQALEFSARLRLPAGIPELERSKLVAQTIQRLGLEPRRDIPIHRLSGGERKRVNVGVELLGRPAVLFLDEPTSGLDPASEFKLMELLRRLANSGCTTICTTHVVENVYLADRLFVLAGGRLAFAGSAQEARDYFDVQKLTLLYDRLDERLPAEWHARYRSRLEAENAAPGFPSPDEAVFAAARERDHRPAAHPAAALPVLLARQWTVLRADWKNFLLLAGQPLAIALLVAVATDDTALALFFAYLSTLWFGCSSAAQEIVRELPIYRRERMVGLRRDAYLLSKFALWGALTAAQSIQLYVCLWIARWFLYPDPGNGIMRGLDGSPIWHLAGLVCTAFAAVGIGFAISALARSTMQAVMIVPLVLIPQILFSGLVVETNQMSSPLVYGLTRPMPSYAVQTMMDVGAFIGRPVTGDLYNAHKKAADHLRDLLLREYVVHPPQPGMIKGDLRALAAKSFRIGATYQRADVGLLAAGKLFTWMLFGYAAAWLGLRARERG